MGRALEHSYWLAQAQGEQVIGLNVDDGNPTARALYEREGCEPVSELMIGEHHYTHMQRSVE